MYIVSTVDPTHKQTRRKHMCSRAVVAKCLGSSEMLPTGWYPLSPRECITSDNISSISLFPCTFRLFEVSAGLPSV